ncbi:MAG: NAD(P)/FAD-dependent oxidoreductase, partial [Ilumatobacter sp.]
MSDHTHSVHPDHAGHAHGGTESNGDHRPNFERHCDVVVVGGSAAGLAAALQLSRQRRSVIVIDAGEPRNAPAAHMHGYLGHDGRPPREFTAIARDEVRSYGCEVLAGRVTAASRTDDGRFRVDTAGGLTVVARRVLVATGLVDELPEIDGVAEQWGNGVIHCPFCHGYEVRDRRIVQIITHPMGLHPAGLFRQLTERFTLVLHEGVASDDEALSALRDSGVLIVVGRVERVATDDAGSVTGVDIVGGRRLDADAVVVTAPFRVGARVEPFSALGITPVEHPSGLGDHVAVDDIGATSV